MKDFYVMTLFPEMVTNCLSESITGRAIKNGLISVNTVNIRDFSNNKHNHIDDYTYGGGAGMLIQAEPVILAYNRVCEMIKEKSMEEASEKKPYVVFMSPQGRTFNQSIAKELSEKDNVTFLCGHYEGIDERALEMIVDEELSLGEFVLTGGELPAMTMIDCVSRLVPGVLGSDESAVFESFYDGLLEYPQYTRPEEFEGKKVPPILLSGDHRKIEEWRLAMSILVTKRKRPDMYEKYMATHDFSKRKMIRVLKLVEEAEKGL